MTSFLKVRPPGAEWVTRIAAERLTRSGGDPSGWDVVFPESTGLPVLSLRDADHLRVPFDYAALNHELELFYHKATIENVLITCIQVIQELVKDSLSTFVVCISSLLSSSANLLFSISA